MDNKVFFLGGYDLEMVTIKEFLLKQGFVKGKNLFDKKLKWGAKLSDYLEVISERAGAEIYGVELVEDLPAPENYHRIDHHNTLSSLPSSLHQVASLFEIELDRYQQLVAANDVGHKLGMKNICCATDKEIEEIRQKDRRIQGVTEDDEHIAKEDLKLAESIEKKDDVLVVKTNLSLFSPIVDFAKDSRKIIVYNDHELAYFGEGANSVLPKDEFFKELIDKKHAWYGGIYSGYFGVKRDTLNMEYMVEKIRELVGYSMHYSQHIFMFPFKWDIKSTNKSINNDKLKDRWDIGAFAKNLFAGKEKKWKRAKYDLNNIDLSVEEKACQYNELNFFYDFVKDAMYDFGDDESSRGNHHINYYKYALPDEAIYRIETMKGKIGQYDLKLDEIGLHVISTGVAVLSFSLYNYNYPEPEDVLIINDLGRRTYPQFLGRETPFTSDTKYSFLACKIIIKDKNSKDFLFPAEDFSSYDCLNGFMNKVLFKPPSHIKSLFDADSFVYSEGEAKKGQVIISRVLDDRMFNVTWYGSEDAFKGCKEYKNDAYSYLTNDFWHSFTFADGGDPTCQSKVMRKKIMEKHTYDRWVDWGTLYGVSRESLVCLTNGFPPIPIPVHMRTMYYQMAVLCLVQRSSILRFSKRINHIVDLKMESDSKEIENQITDLHKSYIEFVNKLYFREVTAQVQGIEIYDKMQDVMMINRDVKELDGEIKELFDFATLLIDKQQNKRMNILTILGAIFLPASLIAGILGMNTMPAAPEGTLSNKLVVGEAFPPFLYSIYLLFAGSILFGILILTYLNWGRIMAFTSKYFKRIFKRK